MSYVCARKKTPCEYANVNGYCYISTCVKYPIQTFVGSVSGTVAPCEVVLNSTIAKPDTITFPHTIGNITFYSSQELIKWVEYQQEVNKR